MQVVHIPKLSAIMSSDVVRLLARDMGTVGQGQIYVVSQTVAEGNCKDTSAPQTHLATLQWQRLTMRQRQRQRALSYSDILERLRLKRG